MDEESGVATVDRKPKTTPVRLTDEAIKWARIASGFTGESMADYLSRIAVERGKADTDKFYSEVTKEKPEKPAKPKGGKTP